MPNAEGGFDKIPQLGNVVIEDHVEIGANTCIDRAKTDSTIIRRGVKLDNLIQIGHNVQIGENTVSSAQTGIAGTSQRRPQLLPGRTGRHRRPRDDRRPREGRLQERHRQECPRRRDPSAATPPCPACSTTARRPSSRTCPDSPAALQRTRKATQRTPKIGDHEKNPHLSQPPPPCCASCGPKNQYVIEGQVDGANPAVYLFDPGGQPARLGSRQGRRVPASRAMARGAAGRRPARCPRGERDVRTAMLLLEPGTIHRQRRPRQPHPQARHRNPGQ